MNKEWTLEEIEILTNEYKNRTPINEIKKILINRSISSIHSKIHKLHLPQQFSGYARKYEKDECFRKLYSIYFNMKDRCYNSNHHEFHNYGGKGIVVCDEWLQGFTSFQQWALNNGYKIGLSIDRIDSNLGYSPQNCQWITKSENTIKANKTCQHRKANKGKYYGLDKDNNYFEFYNAAEFGRKNNIDPATIRHKAYQEKKTRFNGWIFGFIKDGIVDGKEI